MSDCFYSLPILFADWVLVNAPPREFKRYLAVLEALQDEGNQ